MAGAFRDLELACHIQSPTPHEPKKGWRKARRQHREQLLHTASLPAQIFQAIPTLCLLGVVAVPFNLKDVPFPTDAGPDSADDIVSSWCIPLQDRLVTGSKYYLRGGYSEGNVELTEVSSEDAEKAMAEFECSVASGTPTLSKARE